MGYSLTITGTLVALAVGAGNIVYGLSYNTASNALFRLDVEDLADEGVDSGPYHELVTDEPPASSLAKVHSSYRIHQPNNPPLTQENDQPQPNLTP